MISTSPLPRGMAPNLIGVTHGTLQFSLYEAMKTPYRARLGVGHDSVLRARYTGIRTIQSYRDDSPTDNTGIQTLQSYRHYSATVLKCIICHLCRDHIFLAAVSKMFASLVTYPCQVGLEEPGEGTNLPLPLITPLPSPLTQSIFSKAI